MQFFRHVNQNKPTKPLHNHYVKVIHQIFISPMASNKVSIVIQFPKLTDSVVFGVFLVSPDSSQLLTELILILMFQKNDPYCWQCAGKKPDKNCSKCIRSFHSECCKVNTKSPKEFTCELCANHSESNEK